MGLVFTILGIIAAYRLWGSYEILAFLLIIVTLYQLFSLLNMFIDSKSEHKKSNFAIAMNIISSMTIIVFFILSFFI